jgi:hypothetical protein
MPNKWQSVLALSRKDFIAKLKETGINYHEDDSIAQLRGLWWAYLKQQPKKRKFTKSLLNN